MVDPLLLAQHVLACAIDGDGHITWASSAWAPVLGLPAESMLGRHWLDLVHPADRARAALGSPRAHIRVTGFEGPRWVDWSCVRADDGGWMGIGHDVTELAAREHALRVQLEIVRVVDDAPGLDAAWPGLLGTIAAEEEWQIAVLWRLDAARDRLLPVSVWRGGEDRALLDAWRAAPLARGEEMAGDAWARGRPVRGPIPVGGRGSPRLRMALGSGLRGGAAIPLRDGGTVVGVIEGMAVDPRRTTEAWAAAMTSLGQTIGQLLRRREDAAAFDQAARRFEYAVTNAPIVLFAVDTQGRILHASGGALNVSPQALIGRGVSELFPPDSAASRDVQRALAGEEFIDLIHVPRNDRWYETRYTPVRDADGRISGVTAVGVDVTRHQRAEAALHDAERLAALGTLAAGIAHEVNNPLTYVRLNLGRLISFEASQRPRTPDHLHRLEILNECREGIGRVENIVRDLRLFARAEEGEDKPVRLVEAVEAAIRMAEHEIRPRARLAREFRAQPVVRGNEGKLVQVFLNVLVNAAQAIEEGHAHLNRIRVGVSVDERGWGIVEVADTGSGMSEDVRQKAFEPFFTTKPVGAGTGLGLAVCQGVISRLGGSIDMHADDGEGTTVRIALPPAELVEVAAEPERARAVTEEMVPRRRILIVDDEREIAAAVAAILAPHHDVAVAGSGREAIEILRRDDDFDLILCDVTMPEIGGREVYELLRLTRPALAERIVFMTGGAYTPQAARFMSSVPNPTIEKPFDIDELLAAVEQLLGPSLPPPERRRMV